MRRGGLGSEESGAPRRAPPRGLRWEPEEEKPLRGEARKGNPRESRGTKEEGVAPAMDPGMRDADPGPALRFVSPTFLRLESVKLVADVFTPGGGGL